MYITRMRDRRKRGKNLLLVIKLKAALAKTQITCITITAKHKERVLTPANNLELSLSYCVPCYFRIMRRASILRGYADCNNM